MSMSETDWSGLFKEWRAGINFAYPPEVDGDGNILVERPEPFIKELPVPPGYSKDPNNPLRLINEWRPCKFRKFRLKERKCGAPTVSHICECESCPLQGRVVSPDDCDFCEYNKQ